MPAPAPPPSTNSAVVQCQEFGDLVAAVQMLATSAVFISLFYLTNSRSHEIRKYTWSILEASASILCSIMLSEAGKDLVYILWQPKRFAFHEVNAFYAMCCTVLMQLASSYMVNADPSLRQIRCRAFAGTSARFCGFSWITFWATLLQEFADRAYLLWIPLVLAYITWMSLMCCLFSVRWLWINRRSLVDEDAIEWEKVTSQNEIDAAGLCLSFLMSQLCRFCIGGVVPNADGVEHASGEGQGPRAVFHDTPEIIYLALMSVASQVLAQLLETAIERYPIRHESVFRKGVDWLVLRFLCVLANTLHKNCGWLVLFTVSWSVFRFGKMSSFVDVNRKAVDDSVQVRAITAVVCNYISFVIILLLERCTQQQTFGTDRLKRGILRSLSVMVGFSWRRAFGLSMDYVSRGLGHVFLPSWNSNGNDALDDSELLLEIFIAVPFTVIVMPALYWYISPNVLFIEQHLDEEYDADNDAEAQDNFCSEARSRARTHARTSFTAARSHARTHARTSVAIELPNQSLSFERAETTSLQRVSPTLSRTPSSRRSVRSTFLVSAVGDLPMRDVEIVRGARAVTLT